MKRTMIAATKLLSLALLLTILAALTARAQDAKIQLASIERLETRAVQVIDVTVDAAMFQLASKFLSSKKPDEAKIKELISGLKAVYVRRYELEKEGEYSEQDVASIRAQLRAPGWARLVGVKTKRQGANFEVFVMNEGAQINGLAVIGTEPKAVTFVNIVGPIDLEKLRELEGRFGIPRLDLEGDPKSQKE
jgi:hypothetical protein